jgi:WD40 repeat protein
MKQLARALLILCLLVALPLLLIACGEDDDDGDDNGDDNGGRSTQALSKSAAPAGTQYTLTEVAAYGTGSINDAMFSPDGQTIAATGDAGVLIFAADDLSEPQQILLGPGNGSRHTTYSPDGRRLAVAGAGFGGQDRSLMVWDTATGERLLHANRGDEAETISALAFSPEGDLIAAVDRDSFDITEWDISSGDVLNQYPTTHTEAVTDLDYGPAGRWLVSGSSSGGDLHFINRATGVTTVFSDFADEPLDSAFNAAGTLLATGLRDSSLILWDITGEEPERTRTIEDIGATPTTELTWVDDDTILYGTGSGFTRQLDLVTGESEALFEAHEYSPDRTLALTSISGFSDELAVIDLATTMIIDRTPVYDFGGVFNTDPRLSLSPDGQYVAHAGAGRLLVLELASGNEVARFEAPGFGGATAFSPAGDRLVGQNADNEVILIDTATWQVTRTLAGHQDAVVAFSFSGSGDRLASLDDNEVLRIWGMNAGVPLHTVELQNAPSYMALSPDGQTIALLFTFDGQVHLYDAETGEQLRSEDIFPLAGYSLGFTPDSEGIIISGCHLFDAEDGTDTCDGAFYELDAGSLDIRTRIREAHEEYTFATAFRADGAFMASGGAGGTLRVWDTAAWEYVAEAPVSPGMVGTVAFVPGANRLVTTSQDGMLRVWELELPAIDESAVPAYSFDTDFEAVEEAATGSAVPAFTQTRLIGMGDFADLALAPDESTFAAASPVGVWLIEADDLSATPRRLTGHGSPVSLVAFSPDSAMLASYSSVRFGEGDTSIRLWETASAEQVARLTFGNSQFNTLAFSPDGTSLAAGGEDGVWRWEVATGDVEARVAVHSGEVMSLAFSPDGETLASGDNKGLIILHDMASGQNTPLKMHETTVRALAFSPDGDTLLSVDFDGRLLAWDLASGEASQMSDDAGRPDNIRFVDETTFYLAGRFSDNERWELGETEAAEELAVRGIFMADFSQVYSYSNGTLAIAEVASGEVVAQHLFPRIDSPPVTSPDGQLLALSNRGILTLYDAATLEVQTEIRGGGGTIDISFSPDGTHLATNSPVSQRIDIWPVDEPGEEPVFSLEGFSTSGLELGEDILASRSNNDNAVHVWNLEEVELIQTLDISGGQDPEAIALSPDGSVLAVTEPGADGRLVFYDPLSLDELGTFGRPGFNPETIAYLADGRFVVGLGEDELNQEESGAHVVILAAETREVEAEINNVQPDRVTGVARVRAMALNADGSRLLTVGNEAIIRLWDVASGELLAEVPVSEIPTGLAFIGDGMREFVSYAEEGVVRVWALE